MSVNVECVQQKKTGFWRVDTRALVGAVVIGAVFVLVQQIAHRLDAMISPGFLVIGGITWATFTGLVSLKFRQPAGIIMGETQALIAIASGLSPLAPFFIPANGLAALAFSVVANQLSMQRWTHFFLAQLAANVIGNICVAFGLHYILHLPLPVILTLSAVAAAAGTIGGTVFTRYLAVLLDRAGVLD